MRFRLETRYPDYDTKGHVNNAVFLTYFEMARSRAWLEVVEGDADFPFILAEATVTYVSEAKIGEELEIEITTSEVRTKAWVWEYVIRTTPGAREVARGKTVQVMYDYGEGKTIAIPADVKEKLARV
ncbi:MAG TPA: thioesterase family protein [Gemmatimonadaceae bacterium]|nr:thioesterase family protein [Gemmatimonadaceae bacterium]